MYTKGLLVNRAISLYLMPYLSFILLLEDFMEFDLYQKTTLKDVIEMV